ncbi:MAG: TetR-like C-terminal domain-containing protein, partial [Acidimicrobiales bacterium]
GQALQASYDDAGQVSSDERWLVVCRAHRAWALSRPAEYLLLYGHTGTAAEPARPQSAQAMYKVVGVLFAVMRDAVAEGVIDTERLEAAASASLRRQITKWRDATDGIADLPDGALAACMIAFASLHGAITLELIGQVPDQLSDRADLFDFRMAHAAMSLRRPEPAAGPLRCPPLELLPGEEG